MKRFRSIHRTNSQLRCGLVSDVAASIANLAQTQFAAACGGTVFLAGPPGAGQGLVFDRLEQLFAQQRESPLFLRGELTEGGTYVRSTPPHSKRLRGAFALTAEIAASLAPLALPAGALIGPIISSMTDAQRFVATVSRDRAPALSEPRLLQRSVRALADQRPLCLAVSSAEPPSASWWPDLIESLSVEAAVDLRLLLILAIEAPPELPEDGSELRPLWRLARSLVTSGRAEWHPMPTLDADAIKALIGPSAPGVCQEILAVTEGRAGWVFDLFHELRALHVVIQDRWGQWTFDHTKLDGGLGPIKDVVDSRLRWTLGGDLRSLEKSRALLAIGALQGETFSVQPIAEQLGLPLCACEQLADRLTRNAHREGLLERVPELLLERRSRRAPQTARYRFVDRLVWFSLTRYGYGLGKLERPTVAMECAVSLECAHATDPTSIAGALSSLHAFAGNAKESDRWRGIAEVVAQNERLRWQVKATMEEAAQWDRWSEDHARSVAGFLLDASVYMSRTRPWDELYPLLEAVEKLAGSHRLKREQSAAVRLQGKVFAAAGDYEQARSKMRVAADILGPEGDAGERHALLCELAYLNCLEGDLTQAEERLGEAIEVCQVTGDMRAKAAALEERGQVALEYGDVTKAQRDFVSALGIFREIGHSNGICTSLIKLSNARVVQRDIAGAVGSLREALALALDTGNKAAELSVRESLGVLSPDPWTSHREHSRALALARELNDVPAETDSLLSLARCAFVLERWEEARCLLQEGFTLRTRLKDRVGVAWFLREIGVLQLRMGAVAEAGRNLSAALETFDAENIRVGQAATHQALASLAARLGDHSAAKRELVVATNLGVPPARNGRAAQVQIIHQTRPRRSWHPEH